MGSCISRGSAADAVEPPTTAKVITLAGVLREYPSHLTAANVLAGEDGASCFLCSSDDLFFDYPIPPLPPQRPLSPGQLYFVLPAEKLRHPLSRSDVRDLLMRASSALQLAILESERNRGRKKTKKGRRDRVVVPEPERGGSGEDEAKKSEADQVNQLLGQRGVATAQGSLRRSGCVRCSVGFRRRYCSSPGAPRLSTIPEEEET